MTQRTNRFVPQLEALEDRVVPAITWSFNNSTLNVGGDNTANTITLTQDATNNEVKVNGNAVLDGLGNPVVVGDVNQVNVDGFAGNDTITLNMIGYTGPSHLDGGSGNDTITGRCRLRHD